MDAAWAWHGMCELAVSVQKAWQGTTLSHSLQIFDPQLAGTRAGLEF
jgi:hypothetical protein